MLLFASLALAGSATLELDTTEIVAGQTVGLTLQLADVAVSSVPQVDAPPGVRVEFESQSRRRMTLNFDTTDIVSFRYAVTGLQPGDWSLDVGPLASKGASVDPKPVTLQVRARAASADGMDELRGILAEKVGYVGQVIVYQLKFRTQQRLVSGRWGPPELGGLMPEPGVEPVSLEYSVREGADEVKVLELALPYRLQKAGNLVIPGGVLQAQFAVQRRRSPRGQDPFFGDLAGFSDSRTDSFMSPTSTLSVRELPSEGRPADFSGLVGSFSVSAKTSASDVKVGDTVSIDITVTGNGTLAGFTLPPWSGDGFRVYDDAPVAESKVKEGQFEAVATFKRAIVPERPGVLTLPPLSLNWFDPATGTYGVHHLDPVALNVSGTAATAAVEGFAGEQRVRPGVEALADDILPVRTDVSLRAPLSGAWAWTLLAPGLLLLLREAAGSWRPRRVAATEAAYSFADLPTDPEGRLAGLERLFREAAARRLGRPAPGLKREDVAPLGSEAVELYRELEAARYGGGGALPEARVRAFVEGK